GFLATLAETRFVNDHDRVGIPQTLQNVRAQIATHQIRAPDGAVEQALHPIRAGFACVLSQLPAIFALDGTHNAFEKCQYSLTGFRASETRGDAGMQAFEFLTPSPNLDKGGFGSNGNDWLRGLHESLLSESMLLS